MLPSSTKIWLNPFVSKTIKDLYDSHYQGEYLVTDNLFSYYYSTQLQITRVLSDQYSDKLIKVTYNQDKNSLICAEEYINGVCITQVPASYYYTPTETKLVLTGLYQQFDIDDIESIQANSNDEYYIIREIPSAYKSPSLYCFVGDEPICIRI